MLAVVVQRMQVVDDDWITEKLRQNISADQMRRYLLEEILLVLVDFIILAGCCLIRCVGEWPGGRRSEYFLVELLEVIDVEVWYLLQDAQGYAGMSGSHNLVHLHADRNQRSLEIGGFKLLANGKI